MPIKNFTSRLPALTAAVASTVFAAAPLAHAQFTSGTISVNLSSSYSAFGVPAPDTTPARFDPNSAPKGMNAVVTPGRWNNVDITGDGGNAPAASGLTLNLSTGANAGTASGVTLGYSAATSFNAQKSNGFPNSDIFQSNSPNPALLQDFFYNGSTTANTVTLSGLTAGQNYSVVLYSGSDRNGRQTAFNVNGLTAGTVQTATFNTADTTFVNGDNYVQYLNVMPAANGALVLSYAAAAAGGEGDIDGFQISAVPEPSTWAGGLLGVAALLGAALRRRAVRAA